MHQAQLLISNTGARKPLAQRESGSPTAVSLFSGAGGMDVGFSKAGFEVVWANDIDKDSCDTYQTNHKSIIRCGDIHEFFSELDEYLGSDLVFGGPPCQGFSVAGKMDPGDIRSQHVFTFMDVVVCS